MEEPEHNQKMEDAKRICLEVKYSSWRLLVDLALFTETFGVDTCNLLSIPAEKLSGTQGVLILKLKWLLEDSKVIRVKSPENVFGTILQILFHNSKCLEMASKLHVDIGKAKEGSGVWAVMPPHILRSLIEAEKSSMESNLQTVCSLLTQLMSQFDFQDDQFARPLEGTQDVKMSSAIDFEAIMPFPRFDLARLLHLRNELRQPNTDKSNFDQLKKFSEFLKHMVTFQELSVIQRNREKFSQGKKSISWSLGFGKGSWEFLQAVKKLDGCCEMGDVEKKIELLETILSGEAQAQKRCKVAKGCMDYQPGDMRMRSAIIRHIEDVFTLFGAECIDTPIFELKETLTGKYGEDQKLIYDLNDQGGEQLALRYDLTVPFARYCATHAVEKMTRYHIGKVYRRDEPQISKGRLREFYQCDIDIAGQYDRMVPESEILNLTIYLLDDLKPIIGSYKIKVSHRLLLDGIMEVAGVPENLLRPVSSAIDKLDKLPWSQVKEECVEKGLHPNSVEKLGTLVATKGSLAEVKSALQLVEEVNGNSKIVQALADLELLFAILPVGATEEGGVMELDVSLARGLDYYTGLIYEAITLSNDVTKIGSIAAGGRYDNLIGMFSPKQIPAVGISFGIERVFRMLGESFTIAKTTLQRKGDTEVSRISSCDAYICSVGKNLLKEKLKLASELRAAGISVQFSMKEKLNLNKQMEAILSEGIPFGLVLGDEEVSNNVVQLRHFSEADSDRKQITVPRESVVAVLRTELSKTNRRKLISTALFSSRT